MSMETFEQLESAVRSYCRSFPAVFTRASGSWLYDVEGKAYLDFFAGASVLNYGHHHPRLKAALIEYLSNDGITHTLDMASVAKREFLETFHERILAPRNMPHVVQFPGPTGTNAVEAALKLARKVKGREKVISFTNAFHGMTLGSLSVTGNAFKRSGAGMTLNYSDSMPFCGYFGAETDTLEYLDRMIADNGSGVDLPAAVILETLQAEGGINEADAEWLRGLQALCRKYDMLLIVDDIQVGCGRTGPFFSFDGLGLDPDIVCLSKSLSGYGLPMAVVLIKPELDIWEPGEHNGTFRGHNLAFVTAKHALDLFWADDRLSRATEAKAARVAKALRRICNRFPETHGTLKGRGLIQGIEFANPELAGAASRHAFERGLIMETSGPESQVLKLMPPLTITDEELQRGLDIVEQSVAAAAAELGIGAAAKAGGQS